ncbi:MAG: bidirectional hydrogenase complex protein HoxE [Deinococcota bacterium]
MLDKTLKRLRYAQDALIDALHSAQDIFGYLSEDVLIYIARQLKLPPSRVYGVATFYHLFSFTPKGEHTCTVCMGTACFVKGAGDILDAIAARYNVQPGGSTEDSKLSLNSARCVGSCGLAPVLVLDGEVLGKETTETVFTALETILSAQPALSAQEAGQEVNT